MGGGFVRDRDAYGFRRVLLELLNHNKGDT